MEKELGSTSKHDVSELGPAPKERKIIGSTWVFKVEPDGLYKSRFCATRLFSGSRNKLWKHIRSCLPRSVSIVLAIASSHEWDAIQLDVET